MLKVSMIFAVLFTAISALIYFAFPSIEKAAVGNSGLIPQVEFANNLVVVLGFFNVLAIIAWLAVIMIVVINRIKRKKL